MRAICRPVEFQRRYHSGYKKYHSYKFQVVMTPDGLLSSLTGPWPGQKGDWGMYLELGLERHLQEVNEGGDAENSLYLYGDPAYALSYGIISGYKAIVRYPLSPVLKAVNAHMSGMHVSVEHGFAKTINLGGFNGYKSGLRSGISPVAGYFMVGVLFSNIHSCIYRNEICMCFHCNPPSLNEYLTLPI
ncbi:hypothetical protein L873DRAFT_441811 [Choiromyces venosus 120613-1]|uniref:DDE Tnp4 domain-containing protein n=1 Tax=Choiromyces venosus 120613-1 TaxID=1336337 RepID=A0A3N4IZE3_9PEZI|nr:hypothetical protein L873DRAFT_441811 [Choiromyces venosus 120613-1]